MTVLSFSNFASFGQDCHISIDGQVIDGGHKDPLSFANIFIQELAIGTTSDAQGQFSFKNICPGDYHILVSHIGCEPQKIHLDLKEDTTLQIRLNHSPADIMGVVVEGKNETFSNQAKVGVNRQVIEDNAYKNLSSLLENEAGVYLLKNGSGIAKPIVHGLYGNRLTILNNGIVQSGQQWGNDHSPEINPFAADKITVLKGASAIEFGGANLGSVILVEPNKINREPHLHGQLNYTFSSNGRGHSLNTRIEKYTPWVAWRFNGTLRKVGDQKSASYFLRNTGNEEASFTLQLEKSFNDKLFIDIYASSFNTELGVLKGSHIGNLTDLEQALINEIPIYTLSKFTYEIEAPKQKVNHQLAKVKGKYYFADAQFLEITLATQLNNRKEFDIRRSGRTDIPALSLSQTTFNSDIKYSNSWQNDWQFKIGQQNIITQNINQPETGILPLIPDYASWKSGVFTTLAKHYKSLDFEIGVRHDYEFQNVATISNTTPRKIIRYRNQDHNLSALFAFNYKISASHSLTLNSGYAMRNPGINELYSNGLHQGVSGIEEGDINLKTEKALKHVFTYKWTPNTKFSFSALLYHQHFQDYIFLQPQDEFRLTIRGAFPVFKYAQTNARIFGMDLSAQYTVNDAIIAHLNYSYLRGDDIEHDKPLVFMPPSSINGRIVFRSKKSIQFANKSSLEALELEINDRLVLEQKHILVDQDFVLPPKTYNLIGIKISTNIVSPKLKVRLFLKGDNVLNVKYRDYLNRQRYFADDTGINLSLGINYKF